MPLRPRGALSSARRAAIWSGIDARDLPKRLKPMNKILQKIKQEFLQVLPPTIFFLFAFNVVAITTILC